MNQSLSPLFLQATIGDATTGIADGSTAQIQPTKIINPNRTPMLIDQFRVFDGSTSGSIFQDLKMKIELGNIPLTNNYVPLHAVMPIQKSATDAMMIWHLPRPMWVPPDVQLSVSFARQSVDTSPGDPPLTFGIAGRSVAGDMPIPKEIYVPWAAAAQQVQAAGDGGPDRFVTPDNALGNPFDTEMYVTRLLGWFTNAGQSSDRIVDNKHTVKMTLSNGKMLVRDPVPMWLMFPGLLPNAGQGQTPGTGYFDVFGVLQPREFIRAIIDYQFASGTVAAYHITNMIGMVGYHVVPTPKGAQP